MKTAQRIERPLSDGPSFEPPAAPASSQPLLRSSFEGQLDVRFLPHMVRHYPDPPVHAAAGSPCAPSPSVESDFRPRSPAALGPGSHVPPSIDDESRSGESETAASNVPAAPPPFDVASEGAWGHVTGAGWRAAGMAASMAGLWVGQAVLRLNWGRQLYHWSQTPKWIVRLADRSPIGGRALWAMTLLWVVGGGSRSEALIALQSAHRPATVASANAKYAFLRGAWATVAGTVLSYMGASPWRFAQRRWALSLLAVGGLGLQCPLAANSRLWRFVDRALDVTACALGATLVVAGVAGFWPAGGIPVALLALTHYLEWRLARLYRRAAEHDIAQGQQGGPYTPPQQECFFSAGMCVAESAAGLAWLVGIGGHVRAIGLLGGALGRLAAIAAGAVSLQVGLQSLRHGVSAQ